MKESESGKIQLCVRCDCISIVERFFSDCFGCGLHLLFFFLLEFGNDLVGPEAVDDAPFLEIVRRHLHFHAISGEDAHAMHAHTTGKMAQKLMIFCLFGKDPDAERGIWVTFLYHANELNDRLTHK